jgi:hypothetical protein
MKTIDGWRFYFNFAVDQLTALEIVADFGEDVTCTSKNYSIFVFLYKQGV